MYFCKKQSVLSLNALMSSKKQVQRHTNNMGLVAFDLVLKCDYLEISLIYNSLQNNPQSRINHIPDETRFL